jgi:hypothetical protein
LPEKDKIMPKPQRLGGWMTRFRRCIDAEVGAAVATKVIVEPERFDETSDYAQKAEWIRSAVGRLEKAAGKAGAIRVMQACGMKCCGPTQQKRARQFMEESRSVEELLAKLNEAGIGGGRLRLCGKGDSPISVDTKIGTVPAVCGKGDSPIFVDTKIGTVPTPKTILGGYDRCYCGRVRQTKEPFPTDTYCHCSTGWYKSLFEAAFNRPVEVTLKQSILQGADRCEFEIRLG